MALYQVPTQNNLQYTLDVKYTSGGTTLTLNTSVTGTVQAPGVCVVDRIDSSGNKTPTKRTYYSFTGVSGADLTGLAVVDGTDQDHAVGAIVEFVPDVDTFQSYYDTFTAEHSASGLHTTDTISEKTAGAGVTVDGVLLKDSGISLSGQPCARAYKASDQTNLVDEAWTKINLDTEDFDQNNEFSGYKFTAKSAGKYLVIGRVAFKNVVADKEYNIGIYLNGALIRYTTLNSSTDPEAVDRISGELTTFVDLSVSDYIELYARSRAGVNTVDVEGTVNATELNIFKLA